MQVKCSLRSIEMWFYWSIIESQDVSNLLDVHDLVHQHSGHLERCKNHNDKIFTFHPKEWTRPIKMQQNLNRFRFLIVDLMTLHYIKLKFIYHWGKLYQVKMLYIKLSETSIVENEPKFKLKPDHLMHVLTLSVSMLTFFIWDWFHNIS